MRSTEALPPDASLLRPCTRCKSSHHVCEQERKTHSLRCFQIVFPHERTSWAPVSTCDCSFASSNSISASAHQFMKPTVGLPMSSLWHCAAYATVPWPQLPAYVWDICNSCVYCTNALAWRRPCALDADVHALWLPARTGAKLDICKCTPKNCMSTQIVVRINLTM